MRLIIETNIGKERLLLSTFDKIFNFTKVAAIKRRLSSGLGSSKLQECICMVSLKLAIVS